MAELVPAVNYSVFTLEEIDHPELVAIYSTYWSASFAFTCPIFFFTLYTVVTKSTKEMGKFRRYTVHQLFWTFAYDTSMSLWQPVPLWPYFMGYSAGVLKNFGGENTLVVLVVQIFLSVGMGFSIYLSIMLRYLQISPLSFCYALANNNYLITLHNCVGFGVFAALIVTPMALLNPGRSELRRAVLQHSPAMAEFFDREPSMFGFTTEMSGSVPMIALCIDSLLFGLVAMVLLLYLNYIRMLRRNRKLLTEATYKMQYVLFKAICVQVFITLLLLLFPVATAYTLAVYGVSWVSKASLGLLCLTSLHVPADCITLFYFIKPYRIFFLQVLEWTLKTLHLMKADKTLIVVGPSAAPTTTDFSLGLSKFKNHRTT